MYDWSSCPELEAVPGRVSGAWVFKDTRLPLWCLFDNLESLNVDEFCEMFPPARPEQVQCILNCISKSLREPAATR